MIDRRRAAGRVLAIIAVAAGASFRVAPVVAAGPTWGAIETAVDFGTEVTFRQDVDLPADVIRVELVVSFGEDGPADVRVVGPEALTPTGLAARFPSPFGAVMPNTPLTGRFRVTLADGSRVEGPRATVLYADDRLTWRSLAGDIVRVHWTAGGADFGRRLLAIGERAVAEAEALFGVAESEPIDFFVYADRDDFRDILGPASRENVGGQAHPDIRTLFANISAAAVDDPWVGIVVPHELAHLVFDGAVGNPYHYPPRWLNEGIAVYLAEGYGSGDRNAVKVAAGSGALMPLSALTGQFPTSSQRFSLAYSESVSAVDHLVRAHGRAALAALVRAYASGATDDEAFEAAIGLDVAAFEADWLAGLGIDAPRAFGPLPAPAGPLPSDWLGPAATPGIIDGPTAAPTLPPGSPAASPSAGPVPEPGTGAPPDAVVAAVAVLLVGAGAFFFLRRRGAGS